VLVHRPAFACSCADFQSQVLKLTSPVQCGEHIGELKHFLKKRGYYQGKVNGNYDEEMEKAVKYFQRDNGLAVDGIIGPKTWTVLARLYDASVMTQPIKEGPKGTVSIRIDVDRRQLDVMEDGKVFKTYPVAIGKAKTPSPIGDYKIVNKGIHWGSGFGTRWMGLNVPWGTYGIHGTNNPGSIGSSASHGCFRMFNHNVEEIYPWIPIGTRVIVVGYTPAYWGFTRELKKGVYGQDVVMLQRKLQHLGFSFDPADGRYGKLTEFDVKLFELLHMLPPDGLADKKMLARLEQYEEKQ
jgi:L,D-transpeptidase ErfK/SrfK